MFKFKSIISLISLAFLLSLIPSDDLVVHADSYSPYDVPSNLKKLKLTSSNQADRSARANSRKKLVYDVYRGVSNHNLKKGWNIEYKDFGKGRQPYLTFYGWSALMGYRHHYANNQNTYIRAQNTRTGEVQTYKLQQTNLDATKDLEYNRSSSNNIYNPCSTSARDKLANECNMYYQHVGFKAYLPLNELFPNGTRNESWKLVLIKQVGDSKDSRIMWDYLRLPFDFENLSFNNGSVELTSGINANTLIMNTEGVARRNYARETGYSGQYFSKGSPYTRVSQNENYTAIWYGVRSPHDNNATKWAVSSYWTFGGLQAELTYSMGKKQCPDGTTVYADQDCNVNVTILHKDWETGAILQKETSKATVGKSYSYSPKSRGTYKDKNNNPYVAYPTGQSAKGKTPNNNFTVTFTYRPALPNPTTIKELKNGTVGMAEGEFLWRLEKLDKTKDSRMRLINNLEIKGTHFAIRNVEYAISSVDSILNKKSDKDLDIVISNGDINKLKNRSIDYSFEYEYTNHYKENYKCVDSIGNDCFDWEFTENTPEWGKYAQKSKWNTTLTADHRYGETFVFNHTSDPKVEMKVGQTAKVKGEEKAEVPVEDFKESYRVNNNLITILTQNWIPIDETVLYESDYGNPIFFIPEHMYYYPNDIDDNLRDKYRNTTSYNLSDYAIPLRVGNQEDNKITFFTADNFFVTKNNGFLYSLPSDVTNKSDISNKIKEAYESYTGKPFNDEVLNDFTTGSRYYFNIDGNGEETPNTWYQHSYMLGKLGLSDIKVQIRKMVEFDKYLVGSPIDKPLISPEPDSVILDVEYHNSIIISPDKQKQIKELANDRSDKIHSFRSTDIKEKYDQLKNILPSISAK